MAVCRVLWLEVGLLVRGQHVNVYCLNLKVTQMTKMMDISKHTDELIVQRMNRKMYKRSVYAQALHRQGEKR